MANKTQTNNSDPEFERARVNNTENLRNAADVATASGNPYAMAAGAAVKAADGLTDGASSELGGEIITKVVERAPGGEKIQKGLNALNESGAGNAIGTVARAKNGGVPGGAAANGTANMPNSVSGGAANAPGSMPNGAGNMPNLVPNNAAKTQNNNLKDTGANHQNSSAPNNDEANPQQQSKQGNNGGQADNLKNKAANKLAKTAATAAGGPLAGKAADALTKSKLGKNLMNNIGKGNKIPGLPSRNSNPLGSQPSQENGETSSNPMDIANDLAKTAKKVHIIVGILGVIGNAIITFLPIIISFVMVAGVIYAVQRNITQLAENASRLGHFLTGCGWSTDEECDAKEEAKFYDEIDAQYKKYYNEKGIKLNKGLLVATLTYDNPFMTDELDDVEDVDDLTSGENIDYKKSKKKVKTLASNMINKHFIVVLKTINSSGEVSSSKIVASASAKNDTEKKKIAGEAAIEILKDLKCPMADSNGNGTIEDNEINCEISSLKKDMENESTSFFADDVVEFKYNGIQYTVAYAEKDELDLDVYREYLENTFMTKFYGIKDETKITSAVDMIFAMASFADYLADGEDEERTHIYHGIRIDIADCTGNMVIENVSLNEYIAGVIHAYATPNDSDDYLYYLAMLAKNNLYASNGATSSNMPRVLRIRNCPEVQIYCSAKEGCHYASDIDKTVISGIGENLYKGSINDAEFSERIKNAIEETKILYVVDENQKIIRLPYDGTKEEEIKKELEENNYLYYIVDNYEDADDFIEIESDVMVYPLDYENVTVTSAYGWRINPVAKYECRHHNGTDISAACYDNIYAIADGVVTENEFEVSYGNYVVIGHGTFDGENYEYYSLYAHQPFPSNEVQVGDTVEAGQLIGKIGSTGWSTGCHLHIELYSFVDGIKVRTDPVDDLDALADLNNPFAGTVLYPNEASCISALRSSASLGFYDASNNIYSYNMKGLR